MLIDANNMAHRARYAYNLSWQGHDTSVTYGFMRMLIALIKRYHPSSVMVCWDGGVPGYRKRLVPTYKAGRSRADDPTWPAFLIQLDELYDKLPYTGVLQVRRKGIEADDLIAHAAILAEDSVVIVTADDDMYQCINDNVSVLKPGKADRLIDYETFLEDYGFEPSWYVAYKTLQGDNSDNISGVQGIGPKTAQKLIISGDVMSNVPVHLEDRFNQFINSGAYNAAYTAIDLSSDLAGARLTLIRALDEWKAYSKNIIYKWCFNRGFTSLIETSSLGATFGGLSRPRLCISRGQYPLMWDHERCGYG